MPLPVNYFNATPMNPLAVKPGELRHAIQIVAPSTAGDSFGQSVNPDDWTLVRNATAAIYTSGSREVARAAQIASDVSHVVKVRWSPAAIKPNDRVIFGSRGLIVQAVENVLERNRVLLLYCLEVDGGTSTSITPGPAVAVGVISEVPAGVVDGVNRVFTLSKLPAQVSIFSAGMFMTPDGDAPDYVRAGKVITFTIAPEEGVALHAEGYC